MDPNSRCPDCHAQAVVETLRTWCASYLRCVQCGNMWTERIAGEAAPVSSAAAHPRRRRTDEHDVTL